VFDRTFVHPDDREATVERFGDALRGDDIRHFANRVQAVVLAYEQGLVQPGARDR
jgi:hypothetical protein